MKKLFQHPLTWFTLIIGISFLIFLLWPDNTDTGEATEQEEVKTDQILQVEEDATEAFDTSLTVEPEPRDKTREEVDTIR